VDVIYSDRLSRRLQCESRLGNRAEFGHRPAGKRIREEFGEDGVTSRIGMVIDGEVKLLRVGESAETAKNVDVAAAMRGDDGAQLVIEFVGVIAGGPAAHGNHGGVRPIRYQHSDEGHSSSSGLSLHVGRVDVNSLQALLPFCIRLGQKKTRRVTTGEVRFHVLSLTLVEEMLEQEA